MGWLGINGPNKMSPNLVSWWKSKTISTAAETHTASASSLPAARCSLFPSARFSFSLFTLFSLSLSRFQMEEEEGRFAQELYAESLQLSKLQLRPTTADDQKNKLSDRDDDDDFNLDGSSWDGFDDNLHESSDLDREWQRRHDQFHTIGYRDGLIAGKEASAQEGFNIGFKQSVLAGYSWGAVRGVTSALAYLPDQLKEKLVETLEKRNEFQGLYESVHSLSTTDALRLFNEDIKAKEASEQSEHVEVSPQEEGLLEKTSDGSHLGNYLGQLELLIRESPAIGIHFTQTGIDA